MAEREGGVSTVKEGPGDAPSRDTWGMPSPHLWSSLLPLLSLLSLLPGSNWGHEGNGFGRARDENIAPFSVRLVSGIFLFLLLFFLLHHCENTLLNGTPL